MKTKHYGEIKNGKLVLDNKEDFLKECSGMDNCPVYLTLTKVKNTRSTNQNAYYFGVVVKMISEHTGYETWEVHEVLLAATFGKKEINIGYETFVPNKRSKNLNTVEFEQLCEMAIRIATEKLDLYIPLPNEVDYEMD